MLTATYVLSKLMLCFVSVECSAVGDNWFSILVSLIFLEILVDIWQPIWPMYNFPHEKGIL
jgi:hypothetical protein